MNILIAERSPIIARGLANHLDALGLGRYRHVPSAGEALRCLSRRGADLVIAGWELSGGTGIELVGAIRARYEGGLPFILMISPHGDRRRVLEALKAGVDAYLLRPFAREDLTAKLDALVSAS